MKSDATQLSEDARRAEVARRLREFNAFDKLSNEELQRIVRAGHHTSTSTPLPLIHERTPSDACYILLRGEVGVYVGQDRVAVLGPGEVIGESVLRRGQLRSATVTTTGPAEVLRIERDDLDALVRDIPALRETMEATVARHAPVDVLPEQPPKPKPSHSRVDALVPTELVERFEQAADGAGVRLSAALEDALTQWIQHNGKG
jgi:signal-transduction protein with cAMP-binding, CBS, and nucleotidyltransferase domain